MTGNDVTMTSRRRHNDVSESDVMVTTTTTTADDKIRRQTCDTTPDRPAQTDSETYRQTDGQRSLVAKAFLSAEFGRR